MEMEPDISIPAALAAWEQGANPATVSAGVRFRLARLWALLADTFNFSFLQPQAAARSTP